MFELIKKVIPSLKVLKVATDKLKREITTKDEMEEAIEDLDDRAFYEFKIVR